MLVRSAGLVSTPHKLGSGVGQYMDVLEANSSTSDIFDPSKELELISEADANALASAIAGFVIDLDGSTSENAATIKRDTVAESLFGIFGPQ